MSEPNDFSKRFYPIWDLEKMYPGHDITRRKVGESPKGNTKVVVVVKKGDVTKDIRLGVWLTSKKGTSYLMVTKEEVKEEDVVGWAAKKKAHELDLDDVYRE
jgi:hypothetical protein